MYKCCLNRSVERHFRQGRMLRTILPFQVPSLGHRFVPTSGLQNASKNVACILTNIFTGIFRSNSYVNVCMTLHFDVKSTFMCGDPRNVNFYVRGECFAQFCHPRYSHWDTGLHLLPEYQMHLKMLPASKLIFLPPFFEVIVM